MAARVVISVTQGRCAPASVSLAERTVCLVGRATDCMIRIDEADDRVSRYHCLLDVNPPDVRVRDFGSMNGTSVNGREIGRRATPAGNAPGELASPEVDLRHGDRLRLGRTEFRVEIFVTERCASCGATSGEFPLSLSPGRSPRRRCVRCERTSGAGGAPMAAPLRCAGCDRTLDEAADGPTAFALCPLCRVDPRRVAERLLAEATAGDPALAQLARFRIERALGQGGFGAVYQLRHAETGEALALKVLLPRHAADADAVSRFLDEIDNTRALRHRHVVAAHAGGSWRGVFYLALEYCAGGSLARWLKARGAPAPLSQAGRWTLEILDALDYAHHVRLERVRMRDGTTSPGRGLVHRDLKPQNVFLDGAGIAKVGDFGLSKAFDLAGLNGQTCTGFKAGTPYFMPRAQLRDFKYAGPDVDVWAAAATLYYLLTCEAPRPFERGRDMWEEVLRRDPTPIRQHAPGVPARVAAVIDAALIEEPRIGFASAAEFRRALAETL